MPTHQRITSSSRTATRSWLYACLAVLLDLRQDIVVCAGLGLWIVAFWPDARIALSVPAAVVVWYGLPSRPPFIDRSRKDAA